MAQDNSPPDEASWKAAHDSAIEGLHMIREAIETLGPPGALPSEEAVLLFYGPEPHHQAQAIVEALTKILGAGHVE